MRVHLGCGTVYLRDWLNIDLPGPRTFLASQRPDLVEQWETTEDEYYARHQDKTPQLLSHGPLDQEYVCDGYGSFDNIPIPAWQADEILCRHSFEHLSMTEARHALSQIDGVLKNNGILRIDVPDHDETLRLYKETGDEFYKRHLLGPRRNEYGYHMMSYTPERLKNLVEEYNFIFEAEEPNIHFYPAFCLRFVKPGPRPPYEYVELPITSDMYVAEIGPGTWPLPEADVYIDVNAKHLMPLATGQKQTMVADLMSGLPEIPDKRFDYVYCSHVLEHVPSPERCAATLSRIAKRGTIIMPSAMKEALFSFEETDHHWLVIPNPANGGPPIFVRHNSEYVNRLRDTDMQKIMCQMLRTGPNRAGEQQRYARKWFYKNEASLDVVYHWQNKLDVQVIG